jgi:DNA-binding GntR family transcriptional regulator
MTSFLSSLAPVDRDTIQERIYQELREAMMAGLFVPGQVLVVRSLAERFGTSQMPVREAIGRLVAEQALEVQANRSVAVPVLSTGRWEEIQWIRIMLEGVAAERAVAQISSQATGALADLNEAMRRMTEQRDAESYVAANRRFHFTLYEASGRPLLTKMIEGLWLRIGPTMRRSVESIFAEPSLDEDKTVGHHDELLAALARADAPAARLAIENDIQDSAERFRRFL